MTSFTFEEAAVLDKVLLGIRNKKIGELLGIQEKTVKFHLTKIYKKLGVTSRTELVLKNIEKKFYERETTVATALNSIVMNLELNQQIKERAVADKEHQLKTDYRNQVQIETAIKSLCLQLHLLPNSDTANKIKRILLKELQYDNTVN